MKLNKTKTDDEIYYYFLENGEKRFMYRHKYYDGAGKRKEKKQSSFLTEKDALKALIEVKAALMRGQVKQVEHSQLTVEKWLDIWYETYSDGWEVTSRLQRKNAIEHQMKPLLGKYKLRELEKTTYIRAYIKPLQAKYKPRSVALFHRLFKIAINAAVEDEIIPRNRFSKINLEVDDDLDNVLTAQELIVFLKAAEQENITNYTLMLLLAYSGVRRGEAMALKWKNVDFEQSTLTIEATRDKHGYRTPKTRRSYRTIPIDAILIKQLATYQKWCVETKFSYGMKLDKANDFVFISFQDGQPIADNMVFYSFKRVFSRLKKLGVKIEPITAHGLRHTHATLLINQGIPVQTIADRLGNTPDMILRVYAHSFKEFEVRAVSAFSDSLSGANVGANGS
ncbi:tyrosine-type recombinase/integrase [Gorillibacterium timonense]|uniref:tyrosine-type recombinase/integrase n=1 Tax=Gorillibacterium timonense TaxID=1689269 RepID=UPI00071CA7A0|nr:tyrosine-type recombinase/integrase [Gorillibacterium timonense]